MVLNRCCLPLAPKVPSSSAAFELGRQTSFAHLFKVSQVRAHTFTHTHELDSRLGREAPQSKAKQAQKSYGCAQPLVLKGFPFARPASNTGVRTLRSPL